MVRVPKIRETILLEDLWKTGPALRLLRGATHHVLARLFEALAVSIFRLADAVDSKARVQNLPTGTLNYLYRVQ